MSNETNDKTALEKLKELQDNDEISSLNFKEPELKTFDFTNVFEIDKEEPKQEKKFIFGKRANRHASQVKIKSNEFDNEKPIVEDITFAPGSNDVESPKLEDEEHIEESYPADGLENIKEDTIEEISTIENEKIEDIDKQDDITLDSEDHVDLEDEEIIEESYEESGQIEEDAESFEEIDNLEEDQTLEEIDGSEDEVYDSEEEEDDSEEEINDSDETEAIFNEDEDELFVEKKKFLLSQYQKEEIYLEQKSKEGFHFVRHVGKKFYFIQGEPSNFYYSINYFADEPDSDQWREWEKDGWKLVSRSPAKKKREAGWFIFRNTERKGEYRKEIDNEDEKYRFYRKYSNSCRSTMFLIFMCMALCAVAAYLQWVFKGYIWGFALCGVVFIIAFVIFCMYGRMLRNSKKTARMLKAKIRTKERRAAFYAEHTFQTDETEEELDTDWNTLEQTSTRTQKLKRKNK